MGDQYLKRGRARDRYEVARRRQGRRRRSPAAPIPCQVNAGVHGVALAGFGRALEDGSSYLLALQATGSRPEAIGD